MLAHSGQAGAPELQVDEVDEETLERPHIDHVWTIKVTDGCSKLMSHKLSLLGQLRPDQACAKSTHTCTQSSGCSSLSLVKCGSNYSLPIPSQPVLINARLANGCHLTIRYLKNTLHTIHEGVS